jgi:hypothetical protein
MNGNINRKLAVQLLSEFNNFIKTMPDNYIPETGIEEMYSKDKIENTLNYIKLNQNADINDIFMNLK